MIKQMKMYKFFEQVKQEARKVVWPQKKELWTSVLVVVVVVTICSIISLLLDYGIHNMIQFLLNLGK